MSDAPEPCPAVSPSWYRQSFSALYPYVYAHRTVEAAAPECAFAAKVLELKPDSRVLDLCCGNGRHMMHLRKHSPCLYGLDYSRDLLRLAREALGTDTPLVRGDMRALPFTDSFDAITCFFTSFGYFCSSDDDLRVLRGVARTLRRGGRFFLDFLNAESVRASLQPTSERREGKHLINETRWIDNGRVNKSTRVSVEGSIVAENCESVRLISHEELRELHEASGLRVLEIYGDYQGAKLTSGSPRAILVSERA